MSDGILEVRDIIHPDGTTERAYRIGTRDWVTCTSFEHSTVHVDAGPWLALEDVPESVHSVTDNDGTQWVRDGLGWMCTEPVRYESRVYAPFTLHGARKFTAGGDVETPTWPRWDVEASSWALTEEATEAEKPVEPLKWTPPSGPSWYDLSEREFNR